MPRRKKQKDLPSLVFIHSPVFQAAPILSQELPADRPVTARCVSAFDVRPCPWISPHFSRDKQLGAKGGVPAMASSSRSSVQGSRWQCVHTDDPAEIHVEAMRRRRRFPCLRFVGDEGKQANHVLLTQTKVLHTDINIVGGETNDMASYDNVVLRYYNMNRRWSLLDPHSCPGSVKDVGSVWSVTSDCTASHKCSSASLACCLLDMPLCHVLRSPQPRLTHRKNSRTNCSLPQARYCPSDMVTGSPVSSLNEMSMTGSPFVCTPISSHHCHMTAASDTTDLKTTHSRCCAPSTVVRPSTEHTKHEQQQHAEHTNVLAADTPVSEYGLTFRQRQLKGMLAWTELLQLR